MCQKKILERNALKETIKKKALKSSISSSQLRCFFREANLKSEISSSLRERRRSREVAKKNFVFPATRANKRFARNSEQRSS
jgi:hypothetical protein